MKTHDPFNILLSGMVGALLCAVVIATLQVTAVSGADSSSLLAANPKMHYQGRLLDPASGNPVTNGNYTMIFGLYTSASGGAPLWTETKDVAVSQGIFSTLLGDTTPLDASIFNGQDLWLGISVGADPQMTPRQPLGYVPYAVFSEETDYAHLAYYALDSDKLDGLTANKFASADHTHSILPQAFGYINHYDEDENLVQPGSYGVDSAVWNDTLDRFEITLTDFYYYVDDITIATIVGNDQWCPAGATIRTDEGDNGKLLVYIVNSVGARIKCLFHFVTFAGQ